MNNFKIISTKTNVEMQTTLYYLSFTQYYMCNVEFRAGRVGAGIKASGNVQILNPIYSKHQSREVKPKAFMSLCTHYVFSCCGLQR